MAAGSISEKLKRAGADLLRKLDEIGLTPQAAAWLLDHEMGEWRYYVFTPLVDTIGRRRVYQALAKAFPRLKVPEDLTIVDVYLAPPRGPLFRLIRSLIEAETCLVEFDRCIVNGVAFDAVIYRSLPTPPPRQVERIERSFAKKTKRLLRSPARELA